jgi:ABC-type branched-subunit amino acid transport system substrate-binding protein
MERSAVAASRSFRALQPAFRHVARLLACGACLLAVASCSVLVNTKDREGCSSSTECTARFGEPSACVNAACTKLLTPECTEVWPRDALSQDNVLLVGFMGALSGGPDDYGVPTKEGAQVALHEIEATVNGLPPPTGSTVQRHLAMLICDHGSDPSRVARHLIEDANVPVIIGASYSSATLKLFDEVARPAQVLVLSPSATSPALTAHDDDGFLWRTSPSDIVQAETMKFLVADVEKVLRDTGVLADGQNAKIAMPTKADSAGLGLAAAATSVNADSEHPAPALNPGLPDQYPDPAAEAVDWQPHIQKILNYAPHIILAMGTTEFAASMMQGIESGWKNSKYRPWYVLPEGDRFDGLANLVALNAGSDLGQRIIGTAPGARRSSLYAGFETSFEGTLHHEPGNLAEFGYDAAYLVAYAIAIADTVSPTGRELRDAMKLMSCGGKTRVPAGSDRFGFYFRQAQTDKCIDFDGASGPLDFNPETGEALSDIGMWCVRRNSDGSYGFKPPLGNYYSVEKGAIIDSDPPLDLSASEWCAPAADE